MRSRFSIHFLSPSLFFSQTLLSLPLSLFPLLLPTYPLLPFSLPLSCYPSLLPPASLRWLSAGGRSHLQPSYWAQGVRCRWSQTPPNTHTHTHRARTRKQETHTHTDGGKERKRHPEWDRAAGKRSWFFENFEESEWMRGSWEKDNERDSGVKLLFMRSENDDCFYCTFVFLLTLAQHRVAMSGNAKLFFFFSFLLTLDFNTMFYNCKIVFVFCT